MLLFWITWSLVLSRLQKTPFPLYGYFQVILVEKIAQIYTMYMMKNTNRICSSSVAILQNMLMNHATSFQLYWRGRVLSRL
jgi:hypothetical protein